ncbi:MAG: gamma-glutamyl-gamma-aminobutyrate hydrolase family protein [Candidatus Omnitrophota bacterium]
MRVKRKTLTAKIFSRRPVIGLTCEVVKLKPYFTQYELTCDYRYIRSVLRAGAIPLLIPNSPYPRMLSRMLDHVNGIIITGGADVHPYFYGEQATEKVRSVYRGRFYFERLLYGMARKRKIPVLGICYGMQLINVIHGGALYQDIRTEGKGSRSHSSKRYPMHPVRTSPGTVCGRVFKKREFRVYSEHHQAIKRLGRSLNIGAVSNDGIIEAIEKGNEVFAVQWHPERQPKDQAQRRLFRYFIGLARKKI